MLSTHPLAEPAHDLMSKLSCPWPSLPNRVPTKLIAPYLSSQFSSFWQVSHKALFVAMKWRYYSTHASSQNLDRSEGDRRTQAKQWRPTEVTLPPIWNRALHAGRPVCGGWPPHTGWVGSFCRAWLVVLPLLFPSFSPSVPAHSFSLSLPLACLFPLSLIPSLAPSLSLSPSLLIAPSLPFSLSFPFLFALSLARAPSVAPSFSHSLSRSLPRSRRTLSLPLSLSLSPSWARVSRLSIALLSL